MTVGTVVVLLLIGLVSGSFGGMLGVGGSVVMIPALAIVLGPNQHLYQAAAMIVNIFVAVPATLQHWKAGTIRWDVFRKLLPVGVIFILAGVLLSDQLSPRPLQQIFGVFLIYVIVMNILQLWNHREEPEGGAQHTGWGSSGLVGAVMGFMAGLLGIGGGGIGVPLLQRVCNLPLRQCISTSAAVICLTAVVGAVMKNSTLGQHADVQNPDELLGLVDSLVIAACLAPTALAGGYLGGWLTHVLPLKWVRVAFILLMSWTAGKMLHII